MAKEILGLDVDEKRIKLVTVRQGGRQILKQAVGATPPNAVLEGEIREPQALAASILRMMNENKMKPAGICVSIASPAAVVREMKLPVFKEKELLAAVGFELSQSFPGVTSTHAIGFRTYEVAPDSVSGVAAFCPNRIIEGYVQLARLVSLPLRSVEISPVSLAKAYNSIAASKGSADGAGEAVLIVDIGGSSSQVNVVAGGQLTISRNVPNGLNVLANLVSAQAGVRLDAGEAELSGDGLSAMKLDGRERESMLRHGFSALESQIRQTLDFFSFSKTRGTISRILLVGEGATLTGLEEYFSNAFKLPVSVLVPQQGREIADPQELPLLLGALGAAIRESRDDIDLLGGIRASDKSRREEGAAVPAALTAAVVVLVLAGVAFGLMAYRQQALLGEEARLIADLQAYAEVDSVKTELSALDGRIADIQAVVAGLQENSIVSTQVFDDITALMPEEVFALSLAVTSGGDLALTGRAKDSDSIAYFLYQLSQSGKFAKVSVKSVNTAFSQSGVAEDYSFSATLSLNRQETPQE